MSEGTPDWLASAPAPDRPQPSAPVQQAAPEPPSFSPPPAPPAGWNAPAPAPAPAPAATFDTVKANAFAEWFVWARRQYADLPRAQAAARAAFNAAVAGADAAQASGVGQMAATGQGAAPAPLDARIESYAAWYAWAHLQMRASEDVSRKVAAAAALEQARGSRPEVVAQVAQQLLGQVAAARPRTSLANDVALRGLIVGTVVLALPIASALFTGHVFFFIWLPIAGLIYSVRTLGRSNRPLLAILGLGMNGLAALLTVLLIFLR